MHEVGRRQDLQAPEKPREEVLVVANFNSSPQHMNLSVLGNRGQFQFAQLRDLVSGESPAIFKDELVIPPYSFYWLTDQNTFAIL